MSDSIKYPQSGVLKRALSGTIMTIAGTGITALQQILLVPLFLWAWGTDVYGEWLAIYAVVAYLPLLDVGMQNCVVNSLTQCRSKGDMAEYMVILQSTLRLYLIMTAGLIVIYSLFVFLAPFTSWLKIVSTPEMTIRWAVFILGVYMLSTIPFKLITGIYQSVGQFPRRAMIGNVQQIMTVLMLAGVLGLKWGMIEASLVNCIVVAAVLIYVLVDLKRRYPEIKFGVSHANGHVAVKFILPGIFFFIIGLAYMIKFQGSVLIVSGVLGSGAVATFCIHRTLANVIWQMTGPIRAAVWPEITAAEAAGRTEHVRLLHNAMMKITLFLSISLAVFLYFTGRDILQLWTGGKIEYQAALWALLLAYLPINCIFETSGIFQISTNKHHRLAYCQMASVVIGVFLSILMAQKWGIIGAYLGFILAEMGICWLIPLETIKIVKITLRDFINNSIIKSVMVLFAEFISAWVVFNYISNRYLQWAILLMAIFATGITATYFFWFTREESDIVRNLIRKFKK